MASIEDVTDFLKVDIKNTVKTLLVCGVENEDGVTPIIALVLRGDHQLNEIKAENLPQVATPLTFATDEQIMSAANCKAGSIGPVGLRCRK